MGFGQAVSTCFSKYVDFQGRALRSEYWWFALFNLLVDIVATIIDNVAIGYPVLQALVALALILPGVAVGVRRLHDTDRSGWWLLLTFVPLIGIIVLLVWFCTKGPEAPNRIRAGAGGRIAKNALNARSLLFSRSREKSLPQAKTRRWTAQPAG